MANVFLSHRSPDKSIVMRLALELEKEGHSAWYDEWEIGIGDSIVQKINEGLEGSSFVIICFSSEDYLTPWMSREWMSALARQLESGGVKLLPVRITGSGPLPAILADIRYADFVKNWDKALKDLLKALG